MKKLFLLGFATILFISCQQEVRYTQQSPEIDTYKKLIENYKNSNWDDFAIHYADTAKIFNNTTKDRGITIAQRLEENKTNAKQYSWVIEDEEFEMVVTDNKETWVNFWGLWKGTDKVTGKLYQIPIHITTRFINGKIVKEIGYWNNSEIITDMLTPTPAATAEMETPEE